jgi:hypothetical protein
MNDVMLEARPYIVGWSALFVIYLLSMLCYFRKKHAEVFSSDSTPEAKQKYKQQFLLTLAMVFVWIAGIEVIISFFAAPTSTSWFIFGFALFGMLVPLSGMVRKSVV